MRYNELFDLWYRLEVHSVLTTEDWVVTECLADFLTVFTIVSTSLSTVLTPTSNFVLQDLCEMSVVFAKHRDHPILAPTVANMETKVKKYYFLVPFLYRVVVILHPGRRMRGLIGCMEILHDAMQLPYKDFVADIKKQLKEVYRLYEIKYKGTTNYEQPPHIPNVIRLKVKMAQISEEDSPEMPSSSSNELMCYMRDRFNDARSPNLDLLRWWQSHERQYPVLSILARDVFSIPVLIVSSESLFSSSGRIIEEIRSRLKPDMVEILTVGKDWLLAKHRMQNIEAADMEEFERRSREWGSDNN